MLRVSLEVVFLHVYDFLDHKQWILTVFLVFLWLKAAEEIGLLMQHWFGVSGLGCLLGMSQ